ncbi:hypothetical protein GCM10007420_21390 [Glycocaulis albus]|uniref:Uncharacterized protein n=1 Tax=Glycocaulis albus TaxID=1382801 RepID=A0ABQ1XVT4_9PROT|nr:hypothetical protein [Glycocaulis albus]GGH04613.1 hypothetical protein GCM10007420_21390 [Glycocaulis albus]
MRKLSSAEMEIVCGGEKGDVKPHDNGPISHDQFKGQEPWGPFEAIGTVLDNPFSTGGAIIDWLWQDRADRAAEQREDGEWIPHLEPVGM